MEVNGMWITVNIEKTQSLSPRLSPRSQLRSPLRSPLRCSLRFLLRSTLPLGVYSLIKAIYVCAAPKGRGFAPFLSENGYRLCPFWSGIGYGNRANYGIVRTYSSFQFQMRWKEREIFEFEIEFKKCFCSCSNPSDEEIIS